MLSYSVRREVMSRTYEHRRGKTLPQIIADSDQLPQQVAFYPCQVVIRFIAGCEYYGLASRSSLTVRPPAAFTRFITTSISSNSTTFPSIARGKSIVIA